VLRYLPTNLSRPEIAGQLSVSPNTVSAHIRSIYAKLGVGDRSAAVRRARQGAAPAPSQRARFPGTGISPAAGPRPGPAFTGPGAGSVQGWTGALGPRSRRSDCMMANEVVRVKISMSAAASTPVYLAMTGAAVRSVTSSR